MNLGHSLILIRTQGVKYGQYLIMGPIVDGFPVPLATVHRRQAGTRLHFREPMPSLCHLHPSSPAATVASGFGRAFAFSGMVQKYLIRRMHRDSLRAGGS